MSYESTRKLIEAKNRAAEDARINAAELSMWPAFWIVVIAVVLGLLFAPR
jgi:hypothetical protein